MDELKEYLQKESRYTWHPKYHKYFDEWYQGITDTQRLYFAAWMDGQKSPWA